MITLMKGREVKFGACIEDLFSCFDKPSLILFANFIRERKKESELEILIKNFFIEEDPPYVDAYQIEDAIAFNPKALLEPLDLTEEWDEYCRSH